MAAIHSTTYFFLSMIRSIQRPAQWCALTHIHNLHITLSHCMNDAHVCVGLGFLTRTQVPLCAVLPGPLGRRACSRFNLSSKALQHKHTGRWITRVSFFYYYYFQEEGGGCSCCVNIGSILFRVYDHNCQAKEQKKYEWGSGTLETDLDLPLAFHVSQSIRTEWTHNEVAEQTMESVTEFCLVTWV